jgi:diguanylate cyclase (GGDEF)-like protein/PAS domain S-box-containing protein
MPDGGHGQDDPCRRVEELAGVGTWTVRLGTGELTTNDAARTMLGWPADGDAPTLRDFLDALHPDDVERVRAHADGLARDGEPYVLEHRVVTSDGRVQHMRAAGAAERDATGRIAVLHGITLDITELREAAAAAEEQRDRGRAVLAALHEGYLVSCDGVIQEVNAALCRMTGFTEQELVGADTPYPFWPPEQLDAMVALRQRLTSGGGDRAEVEAVRKDGSRLRVAMTATVLATPPGSTPLCFVLMRDVTVEHERARLLQTRAETDPLTGVQNSRTFREALRAAVVTAGAGDVLSLALIDVDHFKRINDEHGHAVGDEVLVAFVQRLVGASAGAGTVARVGGEEFALLMPRLELTAARAAMERALATLRDVPLPTVGRVTASAGVAELRADGIADDDALYRLADRRLYEAKARGRDQVC